MTHLRLLLKKQLTDALPSRSSSKLRSANLLGNLLTGALIAGIVVAFVFIFSQFTKTYTAIKINRVPDIAARQYELMSLAYFVLLVVSLISSVNRLCYTLFENSDINVLITMPFSSLELFSAKLMGVYIRQLGISALFVLPVNLTFFVTTDLISVYNVLMTFVVALILPIIPLGIASVIVLPYFYVKRFISSNYLLSFLTITLIMIGFCVLYAYVFEFAGSLLNAGKLASLFNESVMLKIQNFAKYDYPANLLANIMLKRDVGKNIGILLAILAGALALGLPIIHVIFIHVSQVGISSKVPQLIRVKPRFRRHSRMGNLIIKEFTTVMRTPGYSYMYFTTAIIMPLMAYYSAKLGGQLLTNLLNINISFEICTFLVLLYGTLTNTFCSTGISRDGYMTMMQKTMPYSPSQVLWAKMIFGGLVSELSIIAACVVLAATGLEQPVDAVVTFVSATLLSIAQLALGTRLDLNHPHFSKTDDGEIKEANSTVSAIIVIGLVAVMIIGGLLLFSAVRPLINGSQSQTTNSAISYVYALCLPAALLAGAMAFFFIGLKKVYSNLDTEG